MNNNSRLISSQMVGEFIFVLFNMIVRSSLFLLTSQSISQFMPGDSGDINRLVSVSVPIAYINYPVQRVLVDFDMETEDQVNNNKDAARILEKDLTTSWKMAAQRAKAGFADADDYNYIDKIIGR